MKPKILGLLAVGLLAGPMSAHSLPVVWELNGTVTSATGTFGALMDQTFVVLMGFDTSATLLATRTGGRFDPGARYEYDPSSVYFDVSIGGNPAVRYSASPGDLSNLFARDNSGDLASTELPVLDGYSFLVQSPGGDGAGWVVRGSILDIVTGPALPTNPDPRLLDLETNVFSIRDLGGSAGGSVTSVARFSARVPEPGTLALLGLGLAGLGLSRRRKA
jgi:hypothetical protein